MMEDYFDQIIIDRKKKIEAKNVSIEAALSPSQMAKTFAKPNPTKRTEELLKGRPYSYLTYHPDELMLSDYQRMMMDPQIKSGMDLLRNFLLSRQMMVKPASDEDIDKEIAEKVEGMFNNMKYPMRKVRNDIYSALVFGYSISEIIWDVNKEKDMISIKRIRPIDIETLDFDNCFIYDEDGELSAIEQEIVDGDNVYIDAEKALVYTFDEQFGDRKGKSLLDAVYDNWYSKQQIMGWYNLFLEKHQAPTLIGKVENPAYREDMLGQLEEIGEGRANITIGPNDDVSVLESNKASGDGFKEALAYHDTVIFRKMGIGTMILGQESGKGAYAQSETQSQVLDVFLDGIHADIAAELQIIVNDLVDMNWDVENYPVIYFEPFEEKNTLELLTQLKPYVDNMAINPKEDWFKQLIATTVGRYSDIDVSDILGKDKDLVEEPVNVDEEKQIQEEASKEPLPEEQAKLMEEIQQQFPTPKEVEVTPADIEQVQGE